jgi:hypothetical protein
VERGALRLEAVERACFLQRHHDDLLPKGEEDDALDGPELGDGAEGQQPVGGDDIDQHESVHGDRHACQVDEVDPDVAETGVHGA